MINSFQTNSGRKPVDPLPLFAASLNEAAHPRPHAERRILPSMPGAGVRVQVAALFRHSAPSKGLSCPALQRNGSELPQLRAATSRRIRRTNGAYPTLSSEENDEEGEGVLHVRSSREAMAKIASSAEGWDQGRARVIVCQSGMTMTISERLDYSIKWLHISKF